MTLLAERPTQQVMTRPSCPDFRLHAELQLAALSAAVLCAQLFVKYTLVSWRLDELIEPVYQIVTELVTRAVLTTGTTDQHPRWVELDELKLTTVRLLVIVQRPIVEVADTDPTFDGAAEGARLLAVPALCERWNYYLPPSGGKVHLGRVTRWFAESRPRSNAGIRPPLARPSPASDDDAPEVTI